MKRLLLTALKLLGLYVFTLFFCLLLVPSFLNFWPNVAAFQWISFVSIVVAVNLVLWYPMVNQGVKEFMHDETADQRGEAHLFHPGFGFVAGLLSQLPATVLLILSLVNPSLSKYLGYWQRMFARLWTSFPDLWMLWGVLGIVIPTAVCGLAYLYGKEMRLRTKIVIQRSKEKRQQQKP